MSLRWRIALGFALVALATAAVIALAAPPIVSQGFTDFDSDNDANHPVATESATPRATATAVPTEDGATKTPPGSGEESGEPDEDKTPAPAPTPKATTATPAAAPTAAPIAATTSTPSASAAASATAAETESADESPDSTPAATSQNNGQAQSTTIMRLILAALGAAAVASLIGLLAAGRLVRPLTRLEQAAAAVAQGDLSRRSGLADRTDEFGQLGRSFDTMADELQAAEDTRRRFLQDAAHELKTPLAVIEATSSAILDGVYTPDLRHLETIRDQSRVLARIVDDLRTISLAEGGHLHMERHPIDVRGVLDSVCAGFEARAAAGTIKLSVEASPGLVVDADKDRLRQAVGALVDNALRHTPDGGSIRLTSIRSTTPASQSAGRAARSVVRLAVEDTGPGIPADSLPRIFERFYQADPSRSRGTGTSGLGLSIVRALAEAHGGRAGAENLAEGGARLWIELPEVRPT